MESGAKSGSAEAQLRLAKHYLNLCETEGNLTENAKRGVNLLIKSSRQGNEEATSLLKDCLDKQIGMDDSNLSDVTWCINTPVYEKQARAAARQLFRKLHPFSETDRIRKSDYLKGLDDLATNKVERRLLMKAGKLADKDDKISEEAFVTKVLAKLNGQGGITLNSILQNDVEWEAYNNATMLQKLTKYPGKTLAWTVDHVIETTGSQGKTWLRSLVPLNQLYMLVVLFIYSLISVDAVLWIIPIISFYAFFAAMLISTMQMFYSKRKLNDVKAIGEMLKRFNEQFAHESAESAYSWNSMAPYLTFFISLPLMIVSFDAADKNWIACSEMVMIGLLITVGCFLALSDSYDYLAIMSIGLDSVSTLPAVIAGMPRIPILYKLLQYTFGAGLSLEIFPHLFLHISVPSVAYLTVPLVFLRMAMKKSWSGTYQVLVPHLVCFFWWRVVVMFFMHSTWYGLLRGSIGWIGLILLMPVIVLLLIVWFVYGLLKAFTLSSLLKIITTGGLIALVALLAVWSKGGFKSASKPKEKSTKANVMLTGLLLLSSLPLVFFISPEELEIKSIYLSFDVYRDNCGPPSWQGFTLAYRSTLCSHFADAKVNWTGIVKQVNVKKVENQAEAFIDYLPKFASEWLQCVYGEPYPEDCSQLDDPHFQAICLFNKERGDICHLKKLNRYTYDIVVKLEDNFDVKLHAVHYFSDIAFKLRPDDQVMFIGNLMENLGNVLPLIRLYSIQCSSCDHPEIVYGGSVLGQTAWTVLIKLKHSLQAVWNFYLAPVFLFQ